MAFRVASILGLSCRPWLVLGAEPEREFFPLSGGIDNGVQVTITVKDMTADGATIEFVNRERKPAFTFTVNKGPKTITRSADATFNGAPLEDFGGFPDLPSGGPYKFIFTKRKFDMAVSIGNAAGDIIRYPWYDYANLRQEDGAFPLLTHVAVNDVFQDPEVTLERPGCSKQCHPDECRDAEGLNTCAAEQCFSVEVGDAMGVATQCSPNQETTPGGSMHCCDGGEVTPKARTTLSANTWATMSSSTAYIQRVCTAFEIDPCPTDQAGTNVRVNMQYGSDYELFTPATITKKTEAEDEWNLRALEPSPYTNFSRHFSRFALFELFTNKKVTQELGRDFTPAEFNADSTHDNIFGAGEGNLTKGMYVHVVEWIFPDRNSVDSKMVTKYTRRVKNFVAVRSRTTTVYASEKPMSEMPVCTDRSLRDSAVGDGSVHPGGDDCSAYEGEALCFRSGYPTVKGCEKWGLGSVNNCRMPGGDFWVTADASLGNHTTGNNAAALACCSCGGGDSAVPTNWGLDSASQLNIVM